MPPPEQFPEILLSAAWHKGHIPEDLVTIEGESVRVIHRGTWTHGLGPDFADALVLFHDRELRSGAVEMHLESRGWHDHGHHLDPAYNSVMLHVVVRHTGSLTRRADGGLVPVVEVPIPDISLFPEAMLDWDRVGGTVCAPHLSRSSPASLRQILYTLGDTRLSIRAAQIEAALLDVPAAEVLWRAILAGLGYTRNQSPMRRLAEQLPLATLEEICLTQPPSTRFSLTLGLLLGVSGFLPLSPTESHLISLAPTHVSEVESSWDAFGSAWKETRLSPSEWDRARVRPANHPLRRLHAAAALAHNVMLEGGLLAAAETAMRAADPVSGLCELTRMGIMPGIGADRAIEIFASGILPVMFALGAQTDDHELVETAARLWETLPFPTATSVTRRALNQVCGDISLRGIGARGAQGLIHLDTALCQPRRCFDCPLAAAELRVNE